MKIVNLIAENVKRLVAVDITPEGNLVQITGRNGAGKTSVLDSIWWALAGTSHIQSAPIRKNATTALIRLDLGEIKVQRTFKKTEEGKVTTSISVETVDGARYPKPQAMLDALLGELAFDPLAFTRMAPADQVETLKRFVPDVDFDKIDAANEEDYARRTDVNRQAKSLRAQLDALRVPGDPRQVRIDESALVTELEQAGETKAEIERERARRIQLIDVASAKVRSAMAHREQAEKLADQAKDLRERAAAIEQRALETQQESDRLEAESRAEHEAIRAMQGIPEPPDTSALLTQIQDARRNNAAVDERERVITAREALDADAKKLEEQSAEFTKQIDGREAEKAAAVAAANMPVKGVGFGDGAVMLNGVPFEQASDAEQLRTSIAIAAALAPKLRVIRVRDGSLLDDDGMTLLAQFADEHDMQVWVERVDSSGNVGFVIEDGQLKASEAAA